MTGEELVKHIRTKPFVPFRMFLADGRKIGIAHPELILYIPGSRICVVADLSDGTYDTIDLLHVSSIKVGGNGKANGQRKGRKKE